MSKSCFCRFWTFLLTVCVFIQLHSSTGCDSGHYGDKCASRCEDRHCQRDHTCDPDNGFCHEGCQPGWWGLDCVNQSLGRQWTEWREVSVGLCMSNCKLTVKSTRECKHVAVRNSNLQCLGENVKEEQIGCTGLRCPAVAMEAHSSSLSNILKYGLYVAATVTSLLLGACVFIMWRIRKRNTESLDVRPVVNSAFQAESVRYNNEAESVRYNNEAESVRYNNEAESVRYNNEAESVRYNNEAESVRYNNEAGTSNNNQSDDDDQSGSNTGHQLNDSDAIDNEPNLQIYY